MSSKQRSIEELEGELELMRLECSALRAKSEARDSTFIEMENHLKRHLEILVKLNAFSVGLANLPYQYIFPFVVENILDMFGVSAIWISRFDIDSMESVIEYSSLTEKQEEQIEKLLGQKIVGFKMPWTQPQYQKLISEDYWHFTSLTELTFGIVPPPIGKVIEEAIGIEWLNGIPLIYQGNLVGKLIIIGNSKQPLPNKEEIVLFSGIVANALGRKQAEEALDLSEMRFREMAELLPLSVWEVNSDGFYTYANRSGLDLLGYEQSDVVKQNVNWLSSIAPEDQARAAKNVESLINGVSLEPAEYNLVRKNGSRFPALINTNVIYRGRQLVGIRGVSIDISESKRKEEELSRLEIQLQGVLDAATTVSIIAVTPDGLIRVFNKGAENMLGYSAEEVVGKQNPVFLHPKDELFARGIALSNYFNRKIEGFEVLVALAKDGLADNWECTYLRKDGTRLLVSLAITALYDESNEIKGFLGIAADVTEKKHTERIIKESEEKYRTLMENMNEVVMVVDNDDRVLYVNKKFTEILGYSVEEVLGEIGYMKLLDEEDHNVIKSANETRCSHISSQYEIAFKKKDGGKVDFLVSGAPLKDAEGNVVGSVGALMDISERKRVYLQLKESEQLFETLAKNSPVGIFRTTADGYTTYVNPKWSEFSGLPAEAAEGFGWLRAIHPLDRDCLEKGWQLHINKIESSETEYRFLKPNGEVVWVFGRSVPEIVDNELKGYIGTLTDITERKLIEMELREKTEEIEVQNEEYLQLNEELVQMNEELFLSKERAEEGDRLKTAFLANMSHEIRTPMNGIVGFSKILTEPDITIEERNEYSNILNSSCLRLLNTVNDILDVSKIDSGQMEIRYADFLPGKVLMELYAFYQNLFSQRGVALFIKLDMEYSNVSIIADEHKVYQILNNLLDNALKFTPEGGQVFFGFALHDSNAEFFVSDNGIGISRERQEFVFGRFNQENLTLSRGHEGSGLGLAICKGLVELMGGEISVDSKIQRGSTFTFTLPAFPRVETTEPAVSMTNVEVGKISFNGKTVLVAEDDNTSYLLVERILLRDLHVKVIRAKNGLEAVDLFQQHSDEISLILMDVKMPVMDGFEATRRIRVLNQTIPIVALTAFAMKGDKEAALAVGCSDYISKPVTPMQLLAKLKDVLAN